MILREIIACKKMKLTGWKKMLPMDNLKALLPGLPPPRLLAPVLRRPGRVAIIAEIKQASPSKGVLCRNFDPVQMARAYASAGAAALSVVTEENFFLGHASHLAAVREVTGLPLLRKDFIFEPYQIYESRVLGADAVLLIAAVLSAQKIKELMELAGELGLSCLVEVHTEKELYRVLSTGAEIVGINNRDLSTFKTDLSTTFNLIKLVDPSKITVVSESGIKSRDDILRLGGWGAHAALVGETLVRCAGPGRKLKELQGNPQVH